MHLTKQTHYAIRILVHCARAGGKRVTSGDIARIEKITDFNVAKIVPLLVRGGFLASTRGRTGGLALARPPEDIRIGDVLRVTETAKFSAGPKSGRGRKGPFNQLFDEALEAFVNVMDEHTLADLAGVRKGGKGAGASGTRRKARKQGGERAKAALLGI